MVTIYLKAAYNAAEKRDKLTCETMLRLAMSHANTTRDKRIGGILRALNYVRRLP